MSNRTALLLKIFYTLLGLMSVVLYRDTRLTKILAASAQGRATAQVIRAIAISKTSDLNFGAATPGSASLSITPGNSESRQNATFLVTGEPNRSYSITLPADGVVSIATGTGEGPAQHINISGFQSVPAPGSNGLMDGDGKQVLSIGATRAALTVQQAVGNYSGSFTVTVVY